MFDHTDQGGTYNSVRLTGGATTEKYGLARSLSVMPGDVVSMEVYAKYLDPATTNWSTALRNLIIALSGLTTGTYVEGQAGSGSIRFQGMMPYGTQPGTEPKAYLNYLLFDNKDNLIGYNFHRVSAEACERGQSADQVNGIAHERLYFDNITITQPGYMYIYLSNESETRVEVFFDDFKVAHTRSPVIQAEDYYPFGLVATSYRRENSIEQNYLYNGKELQDELGLGWLDYGARMYMPEIGRWLTIDPMADKYSTLSPYDYVGGNPIIRVDPDGMDWYQENDEQGNRNENGAVIWQEGNNAREGYSNIGAEYTQNLGEGVTIKYEQNTMTEMTETVLTEGDWETQREPVYDVNGNIVSSVNKQPIETEGNCFYQAGVMVSNSGATSLGGEANNTTGTANMVNYTKSQVSLGNSVRIQVDYNNNGSGDHWVAASSVTTNLRTGAVASINFYDPGTVHSDLGTSASNTLRVVNGILTGTTAYNGNTYNVVVVRKNTP